MEEGGGPAQSSKLEIAPTVPAAPAENAIQALSYAGAQHRRRRLGRFGALGQGIAGRCARSTRERCDDRPRKLHGVQLRDRTIPTLLSNVDRTGCNYVQGAYQDLRAITAGGTGTSIASLLLILYVIFWAFGVWSGTATGSATDAAFRLFRAFVIYTLATSWSDFVSFAYTLFNDGPPPLAIALPRSETTPTPRPTPW